MMRCTRDRSHRRNARQVTGVLVVMFLVTAGMAQAQGWVDGFGSYTPGAFPTPPWTNSGNTEAAVEAGTGVGDSPCLKLYGILGSCWGALAHRPVAVTPPYTIQLSVKNGVEPLSGCHPLYGDVSLNTGPSWTTGTRALLIFDRADPVTGKRYIRGNWGGNPPGVDINLGEYAPDTWYTVKMAYERVNAQTVRVSYWIDNWFKGSWEMPAFAYEDTLAYLSLQSGEGSAWFDNVSIAPGVVPTQAAGRIVVANDDWVLSNTGFAAPNDPATFATNVAAWFTGGRPGRFHAYSDHFGLTGGSLAAAMTVAGHTWTTGTAGFTFDLATLRQYDGIFLLVAPADNAVLIDYVRTGGNVYLAYSGDGSRLDEQYTTFVNHFGLGLGTINNGIAGNVAISSPHPIFAGVDHLYNVNGSDIVDLAPGDPRQTILVPQNSHGLYAVYDGRAGVFSAPDLAGTWYAHLYGDSVTANTPYWAHCTLTVDTSGAFTGGSCVNAANAQTTITGGALTIDALGRVTGTLAAANGSSGTFAHGTLDPSKTFLALVDTASDWRHLWVLTKGGGTFTQADLAGTWYFQIFQDFTAANGPQWGACTLTVGSNGAFTGGTCDNSLGATANITGGALTIDGAGQVTGTLTLSNGFNPTFAHGKLDPSKAILTLVANPADAPSLVVATKGGTGPSAPNGDLTGDGQPDLVWQHATSGDVYLWAMDGLIHTGGTYLAQGMGPWKVVGTPDLTGDGKPDLLWQDATSGDVYLWPMNGTAQAGGTYLARNMAPWKVVATGDFCGNDGKPDLLWQHETLGDVYLWCMSGTIMTSGRYLAQGMGLWKVVAAADLNGDGQPDLLWQHATSGDVYVWFMNGTTQTGATYLAAGLGSWKVVATADLNTDGHPDLIWQDATTGDVYAWLLDGTTVTSGAYLAQNMGPWKVVGPR